MKKKALFFAEWLITPEKNGLRYKFTVDDEKRQNNRKGLALSQNHLGCKTFNLIVISLVLAAVIELFFFF